MQSVLIEHNRRYLHWALDDLYKLIHQSALGVAHSLKDKNSVRAALIGELEDIRPGPDDPLVDPISPDGSLVRVHLRPFSALNIDAELLVEAFIQTGRTYAPSVRLLLEYAHVAASLAQEGRLSFSPDVVNSYFNDLRASGFPAMHHSSRYREEYRPAYRVVALSSLPEEILASS